MEKKEDQKPKTRGLVLLKFVIVADKINVVYRLMLNGDVTNNWQCEPTCEVEFLTRHATLTASVSGWMATFLWNTLGFEKDTALSVSLLMAL